MANSCPILEPVEPKFLYLSDRRIMRSTLVFSGTLTRSGIQGANR
ncbi:MULTISPECIES: hypothetical protein [Planktothricoides]|uniref:Uncharacterized protein n=1 Tax=Planktothricoides raciborskii GIHE-MW2 TaxID=2792601 RepID=A0AAU8JKX6_9CYAN|nr:MULTISPECIES: hypothetical protein [Planktothricoides]